MRKRLRDRVYRRRNPILHLESLESRQLLSGFGSLLPLPELPVDLASLVGPERLESVGVSQSATGSTATPAAAAVSVTPAGTINVALNVAPALPLPIPVASGLLSAKLAVSVDPGTAAGDESAPGPAGLVPALGPTVQVAVASPAVDAGVQAAVGIGLAGGSDAGLTVGVEASVGSGLAVTADANVGDAGTPSGSDPGTGLSVGVGAGVTAGQGGAVDVAVNVDVGAGDQRSVLPPGGGSSGGSGSPGGGAGGVVGVVVNLPGLTSGAGAEIGVVPGGAGGGAVLSLDDGPSAPGQVAVVSADSGPRNGVVTGEFEVPAGRQSDVLPVAGPLQPVTTNAGPLNDPLQSGPATPIGGAGSQDGLAPTAAPSTAPAAGAGTDAEVDPDQVAAELASRQALDGFQPAGLAPLANFFPAVVDALENMASQSLDRMLEIGDGSGLGVVTCVLALSAGAVAFEAGYRQLRSRKLAPAAAVLWTGAGLV